MRFFAAAPVSLARTSNSSGSSVWNSPKLPAAAMTLAPSRIMRSRPLCTRSTSTVLAARMSAALSVAKAGIIAISPPRSFALSIVAPFRYLLLTAVKKFQLAGPFAPDLVGIVLVDRVHLGEVVLPVIGTHSIDDNAAVRHVAAF